MATEFAGIYVTGSFPRTKPHVGPDDPEATVALATMRDWVGKELLTTSGGELRDGQTDWAKAFTDSLAQRLGFADFAPGKGQAYVDYAGRMLTGLRRRGQVARQLRSGALPEFPYATWAREDRVVYNTVYRDTATPPRFLVGIPSPRAIQLFSGAVGGPFRAFEDAMTASVRTILEDQPDAVVQFEVPVEIGQVSFARPVLPPPLLRRRIRAALAPFERIVQAAPAGSSFAVHLCYGDLDRKPFVPKALQSDVVMAEFINAVAEMPVWSGPSPHARLFAIHHPWADGSHPLADPDRQLPARLRAFERLRPLPPDTLYVAGGLGRGMDAAATERFARLVGTAFDGKVRRLALATPCGNGRAPADEVRQVYADARAALTRLRDSVQHTGTTR